jgi:hypothetical protein
MRGDLRSRAVLALAAAALLAAPAARAEDAPARPAGEAPAAAAAPAPAAPAPARRPAAPPKPPAYDVLRFREDWASLVRVPPGERCDVSDRWKGMPLSGGGCVRASVGGQVRLRLEAWSEQGFGAAEGDDLWALLRLRAHADVRAGSSLRIFAEGIVAEEDGRDGGPRPPDEDRGDLLNLFAEGSVAVGGGARAGLWAGRRELLFGRQRVIGPGDWTNVCRTFDGAGAWFSGRGLRVDAFAANPVLVDLASPNERDEDVLLLGAYAHRDLEGGRVLEGYVLHLDREEATWLGRTGRERRTAVGAASWGPIGRGPFDWDAEAAWQTGSFDGDGIAAGAALVEVGWKPRRRAWEPRVALGADWASGDGDGAQGDLGTHHQMFPTGHAFLGWADLVGRQNVVAARLTVTAKPSPRLLLRADLHRFRRASADDAAYVAAGSVLRPAGASRALDVATELDLQARLSVGRHLEVEAGWAHVWAGDFVEETGPSDDVGFAYLQWTFTF